ncbi:MAG: hypothetical protein M0010_23205 [Actinomycetota bacterium]|nr:hypothetical protein [Actinomycetota bacterium]
MAHWSEQASDRGADARTMAGATTKGESEKMDEHPIEQFDPLLRNMLTWDLVQETGDGRWDLRPDVAERLATLARYTNRSEPSEVVYFGHVCAGCKSNGLTRLRDGMYLCDECRRAADLSSVATLLPEPERQRPRRFRSRKMAS